MSSTPDFAPQLTPRDMLELGVFGGWYFEGSHKEYPSDWFTNAKVSHAGFDMTCNYFGVGKPI